MKTNELGFLVIHGFAGSRKDIFLLVQRLQLDGYIVSAPTLAGHDTTRKDLSKSNYTDWVTSADTALKELKCKCHEVVIIGFSMGGLIGTWLCMNHTISALILVNTPYYYWNIKQILKNIRTDFKLFIRKYFKAGTSKPFFSILEFLKLLKHTKPLFSKIYCPALVLQAIDDDTVKPKSADTIFIKIRSNKYLKKYPQAGHLLFSDGANELIYLDIKNYIKNLKGTI